MLFSGSRLGAAAFPLLAWMLTESNWRFTFLMLGILGTMWAGFWLVLFRNHPAGQPRTGSKLDGRSLDWRAIIRSRAIALAMTQYFASNFTFFLCLSWMLPYLKKQYHLSESVAAAYAMAPLLLGATSQWVAGWAVDGLYRSRWRACSRQLPGIAGFVLAAAGLAPVTQTGTPEAAVLCLTLATFGADMTISPSWVYCADIAGRNAGSVSGAMNMLGNLGSFISANAFPRLQTLTGSASAYFLVAAALNLVGAWCWFHMRSLKEAGQ